MAVDLTHVRRAFETDRFARVLGIELDDLTADSIRMHMPLRDELLNFFGRPHGGAIYSLADAAFSVLANNQNNLSVALDCSITYHASPDPGVVLMVEGVRLSVTERTGAYLFKVYAQTPESQTLVATMKSVSFRTGKRIVAGERASDGR